MDQVMLAKSSAGKIKNVSIEDLLDREQVAVNMQEVFAFISGKIVLVTGGGGSIGPELCRQIAAHGPKQLIVFDIYENNAYSIQLELKHAYPDLDLVVLIGSVQDSRRIFEVFTFLPPTNSLSRRSAQTCTSDGKQSK